MCKGSKSYRSYSFPYGAVNDEVRPKLLKIARELREAGINTEIDLTGRGLSKQLTYVNKMGIPWALIVGQRELKEKKFTLRDMDSGKEKKVPLEKVATFCK